MYSPNQNWKWWACSTKGNGVQWSLRALLSFLVSLVSASYGSLQVSITFSLLSAQVARSSCQTYAQLGTQIVAVEALAMRTKIRR